MTMMSASPPMDATVTPPELHSSSGLFSHNLHRIGGFARQPPQGPDAADEATFSRFAVLVLAPEYTGTYNRRAMQVEQTEIYSRWFEQLRDERAKGRITIRIQRLQAGNPGDVEPVGEGVSELRIPYGPGYRVYYCRRGESLIVLLAGGDKDSQNRDIRRAKNLARQL